MPLPALRWPTVRLATNCTAIVSAMRPLPRIVWSQSSLLVVGGDRLGIEKCSASALDWQIERFFLRRRKHRDHTHGR